MKYIASCSFGKDSLAMLLLILEHNLPLDEVVFYDTGMEFEAIYHVRDKIIPILKEHNITYTELKPKEPFEYTMFEKPVTKRDGTKSKGYSWCGGRCRWGTTEKLKAIEKYSKGCYEYIGIAYDETERIKKDRKPNKLMPLVDFKMTEKDCLNYCYEKGFDWIEDGVDLYSILDRVSCWCCSNKNIKELKNYYLHLPEYWCKLKDLQDKTCRPMKYNKYTVYDLEERFNKDMVLYTDKKKSFLYDYQMDAVNNMQNGCILNGGVGTGKSRTGLYYYFKENGGSIDPDYVPMKNPQDLYIITTAMKRDSKEWIGELANYLMSPYEDKNELYNNKIVIDSWNNIKKYADVENAFFIFDEDRVCGNGAWVKAFLNIAKHNKWIILSATAGDTWQDYIPVFIANGFYRNKTEFIREHVVFSRFTKYPKIDRYLNTGRLIRLRNRILIDMDIVKHTIPHHEDLYCTYNTTKYRDVTRTRWDPYKDEPIQQASGLCYILRRVVNEDEDRQVKLLELLEKHPKAIIFYNFDYEREILLGLHYGEGVEIAEWSGHAHQPLPEGDKWIYLVQYTAGCEGWNCIKTDTIIFFSQNYSYKVLTQACGRIDRLNTPYKDLYYYHMKSRSGIDLAISKALREKKNFNENRWVGW